MKTLIEKVDPVNPQEEMIGLAAAFLQSGELVAFPTETVYGLGADALRAEASERIYAAKGRPSDNPLIVHIAETKALYQIAEEVPEEALLLAERFWPGPLTMILKKKEIVPDETTGGLQTVAVRFPSHPVAQALIRASGGFIAAPSANTSGRPSPTCAEHVRTDLEGRIAMILDGGEVGIGLESTIVDLTEKTPVILRPGYITRQMLDDVLGRVEEDVPDPSSDAAPKAPGMKYRHYAPKAEMTLVKGRPEAVVAAIRYRVSTHLANGETWGILCSSESADSYPEGVVKVIGSRGKPEEIARNLYRILREFDELNIGGIYAEIYDTSGLGSAIMNRLLKAAGYRTLEV